MKTENYKPIFYYSVMTGNRGDTAIRKSITRAINENIDVSFVYFNVKYEELTEDRIIHQLNNEASALMIAGSGLYTNYPTSSGWYFPCKTSLFDKIKVPIILVGLGNNQNIQGNILNKSLNSDTKNSIKKINNLAKISTVRDERTYKLLEDIGINNHTLCLDPANFLRVPKIPKQNRIALNFAQHAPILGRFDGGVVGRLERNKNLRLFVKMAKYFLDKNYSVVCIAHDALEQSAIRELQKMDSRIEGLNTDSIDRMLEEYAKCKLSIGMKMHSNILSFASGTPFISLYYDKKSTEYLKLLDYEDRGHCIFNYDFKNIEETIDKILSNNDTELIEINRKKEFHNQIFQNSIEEICKVIKTSH